MATKAHLQANKRYLEQFLTKSIRVKKTEFERIQNSYSRRGFFSFSAYVKSLIEADIGAGLSSESTDKANSSDRFFPTVIGQLFSLFADYNCKPHAEVYLGDPSPYHARAIDFACIEKGIGIEIKSCVADLRSGSGLNQERFNFGYLCVPPEMVRHTNRFLYEQCFMFSGLLTFLDNKFYVVKPAKFHPNSLPEYLKPDSDFIKNGCPLSDILDKFSFFVCED